MTAPAKPKKVAIYIRVSTADQDLEQQRHELEASAAQRGWVVAGVYAEKVSGAATRRPELARLRHDAAMNRFKIVFVWDCARLGRDLLSAGIVAKELFHERGVAIVSHTQPEIDMSTPQGELVLNLWLVFAHYRRREIQEATKRGLEAARRRGVRLGRPPARLDSHQVAAVAKREGLAKASRLFQVSIPTIRKHVRAAAAVAGQEGSELALVPSMGPKEKAGAKSTPPTA